MPKIIETWVANCNAHGKRNFVKVPPNFPEPCRFVLESFREIYGYDAVTREQGISAEERSPSTRNTVSPSWRNCMPGSMPSFDERLVQPNSGLGRAISYLLNHWQKLTVSRNGRRACGQQHRGKGPEEGHSASQELARDTVQTLSMQSHANAEVSRLARLRRPARYTDACLSPIPLTPTCP